MTATSDIIIVFPLFPGLTQLDFTGPHQILARMPGTRLIVASVGGGTIEATGLCFANLARLEDIERCDVLCVPGGGVLNAIEDPAFVAHIRRLGRTARYVTSVCTGSLLLGAAGLLEGKRAACHWAYRDLLPLFGAIPDDARVVRDGSVITGGGVTAGIDFALALVAELADVATAQAVQLALEYAPAPPFESGRPEQAPADVLAQVRSRYSGTLAPIRAAIERITVAECSRASAFSDA